MTKTDVKSRYYPYIKVQEGNYNFRQFAEFPRMICDYLIDAPQNDYIPPDDNAYPRARLWKYLYYDEARPLDKALPNITKKMSVLFDPEKPENPPTDKGYRLIPQQWIAPAQDTAQTRIYVYMGRTLPSRSDYIFSASVVFDIFTNYEYELNMKSREYSRSGAIAASLVEALNGVNMTGIGTFSMSKQTHADCGTNPLYDQKTNVGIRLIIGLDMATAEQNVTDTDNAPILNSGTIKLA